MKIQPVASPHQVHARESNPNAAAEARQRAISRLSGNTPAQPAASHAQPQSQVVQNQNAISAEEMGAIIPTPNIQEEQETQVSGQTDALETKAESEAPKETPKTPEETALSRQFAQLARQEKLMRQRMKDLDAREAQFKASQEAAKAPAQVQERMFSEQRLKTDPLSVLAEIGLDYNALTEQVINHQPMDPRTQALIQQLQTQVEELKQKATKIEESGKTAQEQQYQAAVKQLKADVNKIVFTDPTFETIKATGSQDDVVELITKTFNEDGTLLTVEEACNEIENYLVEEAWKLSQLNKIKQRLAPSAAASAQGKPASEAPKQTQQTMKTLTNATSASRPLTARERAIAKFKGESIP